MEFLITGDTHGDFRTRLNNMREDLLQDTNLGLIVLGDASFNFFLNGRDSKCKNYVSKTFAGYVYCVRGNHEQRPSLIPTMRLIYDENVKGEVWVEDKWPRIRYFKDYGEYDLNGLSTYVIGGAYSVDKYYRLNGRSEFTEEWTGWFSCEQLTSAEIKKIEQLTSNKKYDLVLAHICPTKWEPTEMFLNFIDQNQVDKFMNNWLESWCPQHMHKKSIFLFGHYHSDMLIRPRVEMFYQNSEFLSDIIKRWEEYDKTKNLPWWIHTSQKFYMED